MKTLHFVAVEAWHELRAGCRGPLIPIVFPGLIAYLLLVLLNADYLRDMGATDVPRNSPHLVYLMMSGQAVWILFVWAWVFAQVVVRDRTATLHEVVLSAPISLSALLAGRYLGALVLASLLALATGLGFLLVPLLGALGLIPADAVGPQPFFAIGHTLLILTVPSAAGLGALLLCAAIRTRGIAGPFALAAVLMLIWMVAMVVVRGADGSPVLATLLDPSGYAEVEEQANLWTPREKAVGVLQMTTPLVVNRLLWTFPPLLLLGVVLRRVQRERLALERAPAARGSGRAADEKGAERSDPDAPTLGVPRRPSWLGAAWSEAAWHFALSFRGWATPLALLMLTALGVGGSFVHVILHADGPVLPRPDLLDPLLVEFFYLVIAFVVAAFVGVMARRDHCPGYGEIADATPAPLGSRVAGRALAAGAVTVVFALTPTVSVWIVNALVVPDAFSLLDPVLHFGLVLAPSMLELCALVLLAHALVRHTGGAHAAGIICAFFIVVNHEMGVTTYPPVEVAVPPSITLSEFAGWAPWLGYVLTLDLHKLAVAAGIVALAWLAWPRGTALTMARRWRTGMRRAAGAAGALAAAAVVLAAGVHSVLHEQLVTLGGYESQPAATADDAAWEARWWAAAAPFSVAGGEAHIAVHPAERVAVVRWRLDGVRSRSGTLHGSLPHGAEIARAAVNDREASVTVAFDHFALPLEACGLTAEGCTVELDVAARGEGWSAEGETPWLHPSGVWLRAADLLPTLGHDPDRLVRAPRERRTHGLDPVPGDVAAGALAPAAGVAPAGDWRWTITFAGTNRDAERPAGIRIAATADRTAATGGPFDFAAAWWPETPIVTRRGGVAALHGPQRARRGRRPRRRHGHARLRRRHPGPRAAGAHRAAGAARARQDRALRQPALAARARGVGHLRRGLRPLAAPRHHRRRAGRAHDDRRGRPAQGARRGLAAGRRPWLGRPGVRPQGGRRGGVAGAAGAVQRPGRRGPRRAGRARGGRCGRRRRAVGAGVHAAGDGRLGGVRRRGRGRRRGRRRDRRGAGRHAAGRSPGRGGRGRHGRGPARTAGGVGRAGRAGGAHPRDRRPALALAGRRLGAGRRRHPRDAALQR